MKRSEIIKEKLNELKEELQQALLEEAKVLLWKDYQTPDPEEIGFFNITKLKTVLNELHKGSILTVVHGVYKEYKVWMNPQRNVVIVEPLGHDSDHINEDNILNYMTRYPSEWYILNE